MTEKEAFLIQSRSDFRVFRLLMDASRAQIPACHPLHYLQMATEKLAKSAMIAAGQPIERPTHVAFSLLPRVLIRSNLAKRMGSRSTKHFGQFLKKAAPIFRQIDELNPSVGTQNSVDSKYSQPNVEYPWQARNSESEVVWHAPAVHDWRLIETLRTSDGAKVLQFIETLMERVDAIFK